MLRLSGITPARAKRAGSDSKLVSITRKPGTESVYHPTTCCFPVIFSYNFELGILLAFAQYEVILLETRSSQTINVAVTDWHTSSKADWVLRICKFSKI